MAVGADPALRLGGRGRSGLDVRGYLHWSLMGNDEWFNGYCGHFGLLGVDRTTQRRWIRPSAAVLGRIARANGVASAGPERVVSAA